ncbi:TRAP transporter substrate-binding protein [Calditerrivibrio sp.]|uniref:TRAP transporter substrate-binding protein n=1 Tax=Calditerrivibrio sp. TaxID=2792612 RepID=UPI003D106958
MKHFKIIFALMAVLLFATNIFASQVVIKFSHVVAADTPKGLAANYFKDYVEKTSKGQIKVEVFPNSTLYGDREEIEALKMNAVQIIAPSFSKFTGFVPQFQLFDLPFLFDDEKQLHKFLDGPVGQKMMHLVEPKGMVGLAYWDNGFKDLSNNKREIKKPEDAAGLKFRIMSSKVLEAQFKALGANPQVLPFSEVYSALQQGVVDGAENPVSNFYTQKMHEVQKYYTVSGHGYLGYLVVTNKIFWNSLSPEHKKIISDGIKLATQKEREWAAKLDDEYFAKVKAYGKVKIYTLTPEEKKIWKNKLMTIYPQFYDVIGKEYIDAALNTK